MPTYEYVCKECGEHLEVVQAFTDPPLSACTACDGPLRKVFGNVGIVFKGSGFYKTDSRTGANGGTKPAEGRSKGESGAAETAPATKEASTTPTASSPTSGAAPAPSSTPAASPAPG